MQSMRPDLNKFRLDTFFYLIYVTFQAEMLLQERRIVSVRIQGTSMLVYR